MVIQLDPWEFKCFSDTKETEDITKHHYSCIFPPLHSAGFVSDRLVTDLIEMEWYKMMFKCDCLNNTHAHILYLHINSFGATQF